MSELSEEDARILDVESTPVRSVAAKEELIRARLQMTPVRYYQRLNQLLDVPAAQAAYPVLVGRLRRIRDSREAERHAGRALRRSEKRTH